MDLPRDLIYWASVGLLFLISAVSGDEICVVDGSIRSCSYGCCGSSSNSYCCLSGYMIAGIVFGCIAVVCAIAAVIFCIIQKKKKQQALIRPVAVVSTVPYPYPYPAPHQASAPGYTGQFKPSSHPLPPGYASHYNLAYAPQPPHYAPPTAPPPAYSYTNGGPTATAINSQTHPLNSKAPESGHNPFAAAASASTPATNVTHRASTAKK